MAIEAMTTLLLFQWSDKIGNWHGYDLDLSLHMKFKQEKRNIISPKIFVRHGSKGTVNEDWALSMILFGRSMKVT